MTDEEVKAEEAEKKKAKKEKKDEVEKIELTQEELDAKLAKAVEKAAKKFESEKAQAEQAAKEEAAKKQGEFEKLYESEKQRALKLESDAKAKDTEIKRRDVQLKLRDHLSDTHKDYVGSAKYIMPLVEFDAETPEEEVEKRIKSAAAQFVKDNPRKTAGGAPAHGHDRGSGETVKKNESLPTPAYMSRL